jgi:hypothetical protein
MSHSTHVGFNEPPGCSARGVVEFPAFTASVRDTPAFAFDPARLREPEDFASPAVGVGQT